MAAAWYQVPRKDRGIYCRHPSRKGPKGTINHILWFERHHHHYLVYVMPTVDQTNRPPCRIKGPTKKKHSERRHTKTHNGWLGWSYATGTVPVHVQYDERATPEKNATNNDDDDNSNSNSNNARTTCGATRASISTYLPP